MDNFPDQITHPQSSTNKKPSGKKSKIKWKVVLIVLAVVLVLVSVSTILYFTRRNDSPINVTQDIQQETAQIFITDTGFNPATITVKKGTTVTWVNQASNVHQIASDPYPTHDTLPELFADEPLEPNQTFTMTFEDTGNFTYHDNLQPLEFKGTVIVE